MINDFSIIEHLDDSDFRWEQIPEYDSKKCEFLANTPIDIRNAIGYEICEKPATWVAIACDDYREYFCATHVSEIIRGHPLGLVNNDEER